LVAVELVVRTPLVMEHQMEEDKVVEVLVDIAVLYQVKVPVEEQVLRVQF
jgi:hypothetical protein